MPSTSFPEFRDASRDEVRSMLDDEEMKKRHYTVAYKLSAANGAETLLTKARDFEKFLMEYECVNKVGKSLMVIVSLIKRKKELKRKKKVLDNVMFKN